MLALRAAVTAANDTMWDRAFGIETAGVDCRPTAYRVLFKLFRALELTPADRLIDYGCGRGRVLCLAARLPMQSVVGVELNVASADAARANLATLRGRQALSCSVVTGNATEFDPTGGTVFYFFNPFGGEVFAKVIDRVREAAAGSSLPVRVVYVNPVCREVLDAANWLGSPEVVHLNAAGLPAVLLYRAIGA